jgi:hypothetical protein
VQALCHQLGVIVHAEGGPVAPVAHPLTFEQLAAITFTNQAAADLQRKLRGALRAAGHAELASDVDAARIGTIHGFCADLLRDFALRARTRPGRTVITEGEAAVLRADSVRAVLHAALDTGDVPDSTPCSAAAVSSRSPNGSSPRRRTPTASRDGRRTTICCARMSAPSSRSPSASPRRTPPNSTRAASSTSTG